MNTFEELSRLGVKFKNSPTYKTLCPKCSSGRRDKNDPCLSVKIDSDGWCLNCKNCGWSDGRRGNKSKDNKGFSGTGNKPRNPKTWRDLHREAAKYWRR